MKIKCLRKGDIISIVIVNALTVFFAISWLFLSIPPLTGFGIVVATIFVLADIFFTYTIVAESKDRDRGEDGTK